MSNPPVFFSSCINTLPPEIWRSVFAIVVDEEEDSLLKKMETVLHLTHVCSTWRSIVDDSSELWSCIQVHVDSEQKTFPSVEMLSFFLRNARSRLLTMELSIDAQVSWFPRGGARQIILLLERLHLAKSLCLSFYGLERLRYLDSAAYHKISSEMQAAEYLEELTLELDIQDNDDSEELIRWLTPLWRQASKLHTLHLTGDLDSITPLNTSIFQTFQSNGFPLAQIKVLTIDVLLPFHALSAILCLASSLSTAEFSAIEGPLPPADPKTEPICHPSLQILNLGAEGFCDIDIGCPSQTELLARLKLPSLTTLHLFPEKYWAHDRFQTFLDNSRCRIQHLCLDLYDELYDKGLQCVPLLPWLETLELRGCQRPFGKTCLPQSFINDMRRWDLQENRFSIAPLLRVITIDFELIWESSTSDFADMVEDRWRRLTRPDTFRVVVDEYNDSEDPESCPELTRLFILKKEGLDVTVMSSH